MEKSALVQVDWHRLYDLLAKEDWTGVVEETGKIEDVHVLQSVIRMMAERLAEPE